jgi:hypothetical protein
VLLASIATGSAEETTPSVAGIAANAADEKEAFDLVRAKSSYSFDPAPVHFLVNETLFAVPRNYIVQMPEHLIEHRRSDSEHVEGEDTNHITLSVTLPDMTGLTQQNAGCYLRDSDCEQLVRIFISSAHTGSALVCTREPEFLLLTWPQTPDVDARHRVPPVVDRRV